MWRVLLLAALLGCSAACRRESAVPLVDASTAREVTVQVPSALRVARAIDSLSVEIDPTSRGDTTVRVDSGMILGIESDTEVFAVGQTRADREPRHGITSGSTFDVGTSTWSTHQDGLPQTDRKYVARMKLILFETDVPPGHEWDPHAGNFKALWTRTLSQAEE